MRKNLLGFIHECLLFRTDDREFKKTEFTNKEAHTILINELNSRTKK